MTDALDELAQMSARVGCDPALVQGPGGNTSLKVGDVMWVKASGFWLAEALEKPIFTPVSLRAARAGLARGEGDDFAGAVLRDLAPAAAKPSIETGMHALMPHPVVLHAHSLNSMAAMAMADASAWALPRLEGLAAVVVPYRRPGAPLAEALCAALAQSALDVALLGNHGVTVGAATPREAEALLWAVERRLSLPPSPLPPFDAAASKACESLSYEADLEQGGVAFDEEAVARLTQAPRIPDQVVFIGGAVPLAAPGEIEAVAVEVERRTGVAPALLVIPGVGAYRRRDRSAAADAVIDGLLQLVRRVPRGAALAGLDADDAAELLGWDAEHYRRKLNPGKA